MIAVAPFSEIGILGCALPCRSSVNRHACLVAEWSEHDPPWKWFCLLISSPYVGKGSMLGDSTALRNGIGKS